MLSRLLMIFLLLWMEGIQSESIDKFKIKRVFESLLELDSPGEEIGGRLPIMAADYMKNLYMEAAESGMKGTVRTVAPLIDRWDGEEVLVFPLSHLQIGHRLIRAELHMLGGRPDKMGRALRVEGLVGERSSSIHIVDRIQLKLSSVSTNAVLWNSVHPILYNFANSSNLVIQLSRWDGRRMRPLSSFISRHSPFLTIYTRSEDEDIVMEKREGGRNKRSIDSGSYFAYESEDSSVLRKGQMEYIQKGPSMLNTRVKNTKFTRRRYEKMKNKQPFWGFGEKEEEKEVSARILKIGNDDEQKERMGERTLEMTTAVNEGDVDVVLLHPEETKNTVCGKQPLRVDFAEIGWSNWIISPSYFDAGFCGGECPFPLPKEARASNHALVQSALSSSFSGLPSVCCAPDRMESLTILYYDQNKAIVLKSFPRMIVESCGCI
ncbi:unc-129 [Pristionchus pacificus]|nr:unc-129 [Pristionchus pacificus]